MNDSTFGRTTERVQLGISAMCVVLVSLAMFMPQLYPDTTTALSGNSGWKLSLLVLFALIFLISLFTASKTARSYRLLRRDQKLIGLLPLVFCFLGLFFFYFWYGHRIQAQLKIETPPQVQQPR